MQRLEVSGAVWPIYGSLGVKRLKNTFLQTSSSEHVRCHLCRLIYSREPSSSVLHRLLCTQIMCLHQSFHLEGTPNVCNKYQNTLLAILRHIQSCCFFFGSCVFHREIAHVYTAFDVLKLYVWKRVVGTQVITVYEHYTSIFIKTCEKESRNLVIYVTMC